MKCAKDVTGMTGTAVGYDQRAVTINGKRTLLLSGAIHYPRSTPAMWPELMQRSREAGLNTIETYVFWNLHERERGKFDFSQQLDLLHFCRIAQEQGLFVILRVGPYICAETNYGGFPFWLRDVPGMQMRTWNQPFQDEMERWVRFLIEYMRPMFAPNGGPIILLQLENEYSNIAEQYGEAGARYLRWVSELAHDLRVDVPSIMCLGAAVGSLETINSFYAHTLLEGHFRSHPDQPGLWTENWPGWYNTFGAPKRTRAMADCAYGVARFFAAGGTGVNYYMWHGGTNFGRTAMYLQTTSYDFDAPLNEYGLPTTKAHHLKQLHAILHEYADLLVAQERPEPIHLGEGKIAYCYADAGRELIFLCNDTFTETEMTFSGQHVRLPARSVSLLSQGRTLMNTAEIKRESVLSQRVEVQPDAIVGLRWYPEPLPECWPALLQDVKVTVSEPVEQLRFTHDTTDYCWYSTTIVVNPQQAGPGVLTLRGVADSAHIFVDGDLQATSALPLVEHRGALHSLDSGFTQSFSLALSEGTHTLSILTCALGLIKGDWMLGDQNMVEERKGFWGQAYWNGQIVPGAWSIGPGLVGEQGALFAGGGALVAWQASWQDAVGSPLRWWQISFTSQHSPRSYSPLVVDLSGMNKGIAWLNGCCIGRYWLVPGSNEVLLDWQQAAIRLSHPGEPSQRYYHLPAEWLQAENTLVLFEELGGDPSTIRIALMTQQQAHEQA